MKNRAAHAEINNLIAANSDASAVVSAVANASSAASMPCFQVGWVGGWADDEEMISETSSGSSSTLDLESDGPMAIGEGRLEEGWIESSAALRFLPDSRNTLGDIFWAKALADGVPALAAETSTRSV
jgi:hypothetical protein